MLITYDSIKCCHPVYDSNPMRTKALTLSMDCIHKIGPVMSFSPQNRRDMWNWHLRHEASPHSDPEDRTSAEISWWRCDSMTRDTRNRCHSGALTLIGCRCYPARIFDNILNNRSPLTKTPALAVTLGSKPWAPEYKAMTTPSAILATCKQTRFHLLDESPSSEVWTLPRLEPIGFHNWLSNR